MSKCQIFGVELPEFIFVLEECPIGEQSGEHDQWLMGGRVVEGGIGGEGRRGVGRREGGGHSIVSVNERVIPVDLSSE